MPARSSPTVKRRRLAAELRKARERSGLTIDDVAQRLEWSTAKISRIENAHVTVLPRDVKFLLSTYGLTDSDEAWEPLLTLSRESRQKGWWYQYGDAVRDWFQVYVGLESEAATLNGYDAEFVPGLLQTRDYALAVHRASLPTGTEEEIERYVSLRMERQDLAKSPDGLQTWFVLNEAVLHRRVGGHAVMREQLAWLAEASVLPNVTVQVIPFGGGAHPGMDGQFSILGFPDAADSNVVYIEYQTGALYLESAEEVSRYKLIFDHLRAQALPVDASRALIRRLADEMA